METTAGIYRIYCSGSDKSYIGKSEDVFRRIGDHKSRLKRGLHGNYHLQCAWNKYGSSSFTFEVIESLPLTEYIIAQNERESYYISLYESHNPERGYNGTLGGDNGDKLSPEAKVRQRDALKRSWAEKSPEEREKIKEAQRAAWSPEKRKAWGDRLKEERDTEEYRKIFSEGAKKCWDEDRKKSHSEKMKGRKRSAESIASQVATRKAQIVPPEVRAKHNKALYDEEGVWYESRSALMLAKGISKDCVTHRIKRGMYKNA